MGVQERPFSRKFWLGETVRCLTWAERGLLIEVGFFLMETKDYGIFRGHLRALARGVGAEVGILRPLGKTGLLEGSDKGCERVSYRSRNNRDAELVTASTDPTWFIRHMVLDGLTRKAAAEHGSVGGKLSHTLKGVSSSAHTLEGTLEGVSSGTPPPSLFPPTPPLILSPTPTNQPTSANAESAGRPAGTPGGEPLDEEIRRFIGGHPILDWHPKAHAACRKLVESVGWERAKSYVQAAISKGASMPIPFALGMAAKDLKAASGAEPAESSGGSKQGFRERDREKAREAIRLGVKAASGV